MIPILYAPTETAFTGHGIGPAADAISCSVREKLNGEYELELTLPATSRHLSEITDRTLVLARPNPSDRAQPFRIYRDARQSPGRVTFYARHISYDMDGLPIRPFTAASASAAVAAINSGHIGQNPFTLSTNLAKARDMSVDVPTVARALLGDQEQSLLRRYGGELQFDRFDVSLLARRGSNRGFVIAYGLNLVDVKQERNNSDLYTGILPYWIENDTKVIGDPQPAPGTWNYSRVQPVDLSALFDTQPSVAQLNAAGASYVIDEKIGIPKISITATYVPPGSVGITRLEDLAMGDGVTVRFDRLGIDVASRMIGYTWDVLAERYLSVEIGDPQETAASAITDARRLTHGTIDSQRFGARTISGGAIRSKAVSSVELGDNSVTVNKIVKGAVVTEKIEDGAVTGIKVLDQAISYAKLDETLQVFYTDTLAANAIYSGFLHADGSVTASVVTIANYVSVAGTPYKPGTYHVTDNNTTYSLSNDWGSATKTVRDYAGDAIGTVSDGYYYASLSGSSNSTPYSLSTLVPYNAD